MRASYPVRRSALPPGWGDVVFDRTGGDAPPHRSNSVAPYGHTASVTVVRLSGDWVSPRGASRASRLSSSRERCAWREKERCAKQTGEAIESRHAAKATPRPASHHKEACPLSKQTDSQDSFGCSHPTTPSAPRRDFLLVLVLGHHKKPYQARSAESPRGAPGAPGASVTSSRFVTRSVFA